MAIFAPAPTVIWLKSLAGDAELAASDVVCLNEQNNTVLQMAKGAKLTKESSSSLCTTVLLARRSR